MSSIKSLLESIDKINATSSVEIAPIKTLEYDNNLLEEWEEFKKSYDINEQKINEIAPALAAVGGALARGAVTAGTAAAKGIANVAKAVAPAAKNLATTAAKQAVVATAKTLGGSSPPSQPQTQQANAEQDKQAREKIAKDTAANIQKIKSSTGSNINVPGVTQSILKAAAGQQLAPGDTKHLSTMIDPITKALTDPVKSKKLSDIFRMP